MAAGNEHAVGIQNIHETYLPSLSIASLENKTLRGTYLRLGENTPIPYTESTTLKQF